MHGRIGALLPLASTHWEDLLSVTPAITNHFHGTSVTGNGGVCMAVCVHWDHSSKVKATGLGQDDRGASEPHSVTLALRASICQCTC